MTLQGDHFRLLAAVGQAQATEVGLLRLPEADTDLAIETGNEMVIEGESGTEMEDYTRRLLVLVLPDMEIVIANVGVLLVSLTAMWRIGFGTEALF